MSSTMKRTFGGTHSGWIGLRSTPRIFELGNRSPTGQLVSSIATKSRKPCGILSIAQMPVPVPISKTS